MSNILVINGPNLNLLGKREPDRYGTTTLAEIESELTQLATQAGHTVVCIQSNAEHELIDQIQQAPQSSIEFIIINPAAFSHTSIALRDALLAVKIPYIEVHISNIYQREAFRQHSYFSDAANGVIIGLGVKGYQYAMQSALHFLNK